MISENLEQVLEKIERAAISIGRNSADVRLIVVTKGHSQDVIQEVIEAGATDLGENYVEEAVPKILNCSGVNKVNWHMIGHVQSRKARAVCEYFSWLHSLDSLKLAKKLDIFALEAGFSLPVLLECNVSGEGSKFGFSVQDEKDWPSFLDEIGQIVSLPGLKVKGLMTMAPFDENPENARPYFVRLRRFRDFLSAQFQQTAWEDLSMGMSQDYEVAIQEGATMVRIGTAILGPRPMR